jgi:hypothetical protein
MFVFYNQLLSSMEQFGIYLVPLHQVKHQVDLCPTHVNGVEIMDQRWRTYGQKLIPKTTEH